MRTATTPWSMEFAGRVDELEIESEVLRSNPLGDPAVRPLWVYVPPGTTTSRIAASLPCSSSRA